MACGAIVHSKNSCGVNLNEFFFGGGEKVYLISIHLNLMSKVKYLLKLKKLKKCESQTMGITTPILSKKNLNSFKIPKHLYPRWMKLVNFVEYFSIFG